jgi:DNA recombination protein RmuC
MHTPSIGIGFAVGVILTYIILHLLRKISTVKKADFDNLLSKFNDVTVELKLREERLNAATAQNQSLTETNKLQLNEINQHKQKTAELEARYNSATELLESYKSTTEKQTTQIETLNRELTGLIAEKSTLSANNTALLEKMATQKKEMEDIQRTAHFQFEKIANQLFEEKSARFTETNKTNIESLLNPLKEDISKFKTKVEETYDKESKQRFSLEEKVKALIEQTNKVSTEANNLAAALKGQTKKQGDWGEMILERILETSGLTKNREYFVQETIKDEEGRHLRPDILVKLPDDRVIIIDSKVSLVAYDRFAATETADEQKVFLSEHVRSIYSHIDNLHEKKYDNLENSLDFTMMFIPIEPAYLIAIQADQDLWAHAYSKRILLISPTNLIACLKLISDLWNREKQNKNAMEIVRRGELLYEKFVVFTTSLEEIGKNLSKTQTAYHAAVDQLKNGRGNMIAQALQLKSLGLKSSKKIPAAMLPLDTGEEDTAPNENNPTS